MKRLVLLLTAYILPAFNPQFPGMIIRCEATQMTISHCHWECEFGEETETYIENENKKVRATGCKPKPQPTEIRCPEPFHFGVNPV